MQQQFPSNPQTKVKINSFSPKEEKCTNYAPFFLTGIWLLNFLVMSIYISQKVEIEVIDNSYMNLRFFKIFT